MSLGWIIALLLQPLAAIAQPGDLDPSFGKGGRVLTPIDNGILTADVAMAKAGLGRTVLGGERSLVRYLPNGTLDRSFGRTGRRSIEVPAARFAIEDISADRRGRVVAVGTAWGESGGAKAFVARYLADGTPDPGFGSQGMVITDFGFPTPSPTVPEPFPINYPQVVETNGVALDSEGRVILTGTESAFVSACKTSTRAYSYGYVARLKPDGTQDTSFGDGGLVIDKESSWAGTPVLDARGNPFYTSDHRDDCSENEDSSLIRLSGSGKPDSAFGIAGRVQLLPPSATILDVAVDGRGRIWTLTRPSSREGAYRWLNQGVVTRLHPNGEVDTGFGTGGGTKVWLRGEESRFSAMAVDSHGRALLAGKAVSARTPKQEKHGLLPYMRFALVRLNASGEIDRRFGRGGRVLTAFVPRSWSGATDLVVQGENRILVGGLAQSKAVRAGRGFALARYLGGR